MNENFFSICDRIRTIKFEDEWWFYQCAGRFNNEQSTRDILLPLQSIFDNRWYVNIRNKHICAQGLLGGIHSIMRLAYNIYRLGGISKLGRQVKDDLRNITKCSDTILELEVLSCFAEEGFKVIPYPVLNNGRVPDSKVTVGNIDIFIEITHNEWPQPNEFPGFDWKSKQGNKIITKCVDKAVQLPDSGRGVIVLNPPFFIDSEIGQVILESMKGFFLPGLYRNISGIILVNKLAERSSFIKAQPIPIANIHAAKRCDYELVKLSEALRKHPQAPFIINK